MTAKSNTALLLIDIQNDYFPDGKWPVENMAHAADNAAKILGHARAKNDFIAHIHHEIPVDNAPFFEPGTTGAEINSSVAPHANESTFLKHRPNSFHETILLDTLQSNNISRVILVGAMSQMCIDATARAAADFGFEVVVIHDATAARPVEFNTNTIPAADVHSVIMGALSRTYATVIDTNAYLSAP